MRIIQVCGTSGVGKTTLARALIETGLRRGEIMLNGEPKELWYDWRTVLVGKYSGAKCGGIDAGRYTSDTLIETLGLVIREYKPMNIVFESLLLGKLYTFKSRIFGLARKNGYQYIQLVLTADYKTIAERVIGRSGNDGCNFERMISEQRACIRSSLKLKREGAAALFIDTSAKSGSEVAEMVLRLLGKESNGTNQ